MDIALKFHKSEFTDLSTQPSLLSHVLVIGCQKKSADVRKSQFSKTLAISLEALLDISTHELGFRL